MNSVNMLNYQIYIFTFILIIAGTNFSSYGQASDQISIDDDIELAQVRIDSLERIAANATNDSVLWHSHKQLARFHMRMGNFYKALIYINKSDSLSELVDNDFVKAETQYYYGSILLETGNLEASSQKYKQAIQLFRLCHDTIWVSNTFNSLGVIQYTKNNLDSAKYYFKMAFKESGYDKKHSGYSLANIGGLFAIEEKYDSAFFFYHLGLESALNIKNDRLRSMCWANISEAYRLLGKYTLSNIYLDSCIALDKATGAAYTLYNRYYDRAMVYKAIKNYDSAALYFERHINLKNTIYNSNQFGRLAELQINNATLKKNQEILAAKHESSRIALELQKRKQRTWILGSISFFIALIFLSLFLRHKAGIRKKEQLYLKDKQLLKIENTLAQTKIENQKLREEKLTENLKYKERDLTNLALNIARKKEFTAEILEEVKQVINLEPSEQNKALRNLKLLLVQNMDEGETLDEFQKNIQLINARYYSSLSESFPNLTQNEINTCGLIRLGLSTREIARVKSISIKSAEMARYRIRKKLALEAHKDLAEFLRKI